MDISHLDGIGARGILIKTEYEGLEESYVASAIWSLNFDFDCIYEREIVILFYR